jgi:hypothetical protein
VPSAEYMREYRSANPEYRAELRKQRAARGRALSRLKDMYPSQFARLYQEELNNSSKTGEAK